MTDPCRFWRSAMPWLARDNARKGKPHPNLNHACLHQLGIKDASTAMVGRRHSQLCLSGKGLGIDGDRVCSPVAFQLKHSRGAPSCSQE